jgi:hypothetical protein
MGFFALLIIGAILITWGAAIPLARIERRKPRVGTAPYPPVKGK